MNKASRLHVGSLLVATTHSLLSIIQYERKLIRVNCIGNPARRCLWRLLTVIRSSPETYRDSALVSSFISNAAPDDAGNVDRCVGTCRFNPSR